MKSASVSKNTRRQTRHKRIRARVVGTANKPRLAVFKSNRSVYVQLIDDEAGKTLLAIDSRKVKGNNTKERAMAVGKEIAKQAKGAGIEKVVFDRGGFRYQGAVAALADAAREGGLKF